VASFTSFLTTIFPIDKQVHASRYLFIQVAPRKLKNIEKSGLKTIF
jgi:hypothetical protein